MMIYNTTIVSGNGNRWVDAMGKVLTSIGGSNVFVGKNVWTDGKVIFGYSFPSSDVVKIQKKKVIPADYFGIPIAFYSNRVQSNREFTLYYFEQQTPPVRDKYVVFEMNKCPDIENYSGVWFNGKNLRLWVCYDNNDSTHSHFIVDHKTNNWVQFPNSEFSNVAILDLNNAGCGAWVNGYGDYLEYIWIVNSDVTNGFYWNMNDIVEDLKADEEYDHSYTEVDPTTGEETLIYDKVEAQYGQWVEYYTHSDDSSNMGDYVVNARFNNETGNATFVCDCCCKLRLVKTTGTEDSPIYETIYKYMDVNISGRSYSSHEHHSYSSIVIDDGFVYNGENRTMSVTWNSLDGQSHTHVFRGISPNCRGAVIRGVPYVFNFSGSSGMYQPIVFYYQPLNDEYYVFGQYPETTRLRYYNDLSVLANQWSYVPPE